MPKYKLFAALEAGSNSISMKIVHFDKTNGITVVDTLEKNLSLGRQTYKYGKIPYNTVDELCSVFTGFKTKMDEYGVTDYVACATSAVREASNSEYVIDQVMLRTGIKINILNNEEERFLHNKALGLNLEAFDRVIDEGAAIIDLSSGSLQISTYEKGRLSRSENVALGPLRVMEEFSPLKESGRVVETIDEYIRAESLVFQRYFSYMDKKNFILCGTGAEFLKMATASENITREMIEKFVKQLSHDDLEEVSGRYGLTYDQGVVVFLSLLIYKNFIPEEDITIYSPPVSLSDGLCVEYAEKNDMLLRTSHPFSDDMISSAEYYAKRYHCDKKHYQKVTEFSSAIGRYMSKRFGINKRDLQLLAVASIFSGCGLYLRNRDYSQYSSDIFRANSVLGLSEREKDMVSYIILLHDGDGLPKDDPKFEYFPKSRKLTISKLGAILAVAETLDSGRRQKISQIKISFKEDTLLIKAAHEEDITLERFAFSKAAEFFEDVFGVQCRLI